MNASFLFLALIPLAWLVPNHYAPWPAALPDGWALAALALAALLARRAARMPLAWAAAAGVAAASATMQWAWGQVLFGGDVVVLLLYLLGFVLALALGQTLAAPGPALANARWQPLEVVALAMLACALVSVAIALIQWTGALSLGLWGADIKPGTRPFGNVAQPNHLAMLLFLGLCSLALLRETARVGPTGFWWAGLFLVWGITMSSSRAGWVEVAVLVLVPLLLRRRVATRVRTGHAALLALALLLFTLAWPSINDALLLSGGRSVAVEIGGGERIPFWRLALDAVAHQPWLGWGWQQVPLAQFALAPEHPLIPHLYEHSHNTVLDVLLWAGVPVGLLIIGGVALALWQQWRALNDPRAVWLMAAVLGTLAYAQLEFPLEYAYFLLPFGLALGALHALAPAGRELALPRWALRGAGLLLAGLLAWVGAEYLQAEQSYRLLRLESARIGTVRVESLAPELTLLTQLRAFQEFARTEARPGMSAAEVRQMRHVAQRYGYPPVLFRYALAAGLNGDPAEARLTLLRLCRMHNQERCDEGRQAWAVLQQRYPVLRAVTPP